MLAIVDYFGCVTRDRIRSGAPAYKCAGFKKVNLESGLAQSGGRGEAGQTSADHDHRGHSEFLTAAVLADHRHSRTMASAAPAAVDQQHGYGEHNYEKYNIG